MFGLITIYLTVKVVFTKITTYFADLKAAKQKPLLDIHIAAYQGDIEAVRNAVKHGGNIYAKCKTNFANKPIHTAAERGHPIIIDYFLQQGVPIDIVNNAGETPLHLAALYNKTQAMEFLISNGANIHKKDNCKRTALHLAAMSGSANSLCLLIKHGANLDGQDLYGWSPLHNQIKAVNFFLKQGIPADFETVHGYTLLHAACRYGIYYKHTGCF
ncbi:ankyrin repeat, PH and SEC7 domain containing protein secG-like [Diabrotica virgifera virgifera]|uniref:Ankyrin repeat, PH and SEC7 domain containing protein secG-like n=1 Tax=Diabrotica virgifera virgifera TaxID=50390 RepID=A0A6P7GPS6_DIAVI|nr:ankyrin repeat, PH and SEC7 domain containing protein secG-like [Diabrotica virgifera virgifera]